jgi:hypothetical protein
LGFSPSPPSGSSFPSPALDWNGEEETNGEEELEEREGEEGKSEQKEVGGAKKYGMVIQR